MLASNAAHLARLLKKNNYPECLSSGLAAASVIASKILNIQSLWLLLAFLAEPPLPAFIARADLTRYIGR